MTPTPWLDLMDEMASTLDAAFASSDITIQVTKLLNTNPTPPSIDFWPSDPRGADSAGFGDLGGEIVLRLRARVQTADQEAGQELLVRFMDDADELSIAAALMEDQTLNGLASSVDVEQTTGFTLDPDSGGKLMAAYWSVTIVNGGS